MKIIKDGHSYELDNLKEDGSSILNFYMDKNLHNGESQSGPSLQEVLRACLQRVESLDLEKSAEENYFISMYLREAILQLELRAFRVKLEKNISRIETFKTYKSGHIFTLKEDENDDV